MADMNCKSTNAQPDTTIIVNGVPHAGVIMHTCTKPEHTPDEPCRCACGLQYLKNYK